MVRKNEIPRNIVIDGVKCLVWYKGQPLACDICNNNHKGADCPIKGKCHRCHQAGHFVRNCPKPVWFVPGNPVDSDSDDDNADGDNNNDVNGKVVADNVAGPVAHGSVAPVVVPVVPVSSSPAASASEVGVVSEGVDSVVSSQGSISVLGADLPVSSAGPEAMCVDLRDNELDELVSQPLRVSESGVVGERVLDPSPSDSDLEASAGQCGVHQEKVLEFSPSFSPLLGTDSCVTPSSGVSGVL